jgi:hypothetical protein
LSRLVLCLIPGRSCAFSQAALPIEDISENPSFIFLWVGSSEGLDLGRLLLRKWGFRRCEDICWVKTNKTSQVEFPSCYSSTYTFPYDDDDDASLLRLIANAGRFSQV